MSRPFCPPITSDGDALYLKGLSQHGGGDGNLSNETAFKACRAQCLQPGYLRE